MAGYGSGKGNELRHEYLQYNFLSENQEYTSTDFMFTWYNDPALIDKPKKMSLVQRFRRMMMKPRDRAFLEKGITDERGELTYDGVKLLHSFLLEKFGDEFKTAVVDALPDNK